MRSGQFPPGSDGSRSADPSTIVVAGTNGKSGTACLLAHILRRAGHPLEASIVEVPPLAPPQAAFGAEPVEAAIVTNVAADDLAGGRGRTVADLAAEAAFVAGRVRDGGVL